MPQNLSTLLSFGIVAFFPLDGEVRLQNAVPKPPCRPVRFEDVAGGHFVEEMDEAQGEHPDRMLQKVFVDGYFTQLTSNTSK